MPYLSQILTLGSWRRTFQSLEWFEIQEQQEKDLVEMNPWINFIYLFIWPSCIIKQLHRAFYLLGVFFVFFSCSNTEKVMIKLPMRLLIIFYEHCIYNTLGICKLLNRKLCVETTWILQFYQDNASRFQQGWFQLICDKWEDKAISAHHDTLCS